MFSLKVNADLVALDALDDSMRELVGSKKRVAAVRKYVGYDVYRDKDFDTLIDMARAQSNATVAILSVISDHSVLYQASSGDLGEADGWSDYVALSCLVERDCWEPDFEMLARSPSDQEDMRIWGAPVVIDGCAIGSFCLVRYGAPEDEASDEVIRNSVSRGADLAASLYELKESARSKALSDIDLTQTNIRHALALRAGGIATWSWQEGRDVVEVDDQLRAFFGLPAEGVISKEQIYSHIDPEDLIDIQTELSKIPDSDEDVMVEFRVPNSQKHLLSIGHVFERDRNGKPLKILGVVIDLTESKRSEEKKSLLLREVNHRVKNMLAILQSLAGQTLRHSQSPQDFTRAFAGRLQALAASHGLLSDHEWDDIDLHDLLRTQIVPYAANYDRQVSINGPSFFIDADAAIALGLVVHELATNALRYGALSTGLGHVDIDVDVQMQGKVPQLKIQWKESGGPAPINDDKSGFGSILIRHGMSKVIGSEVDVKYEEDGAFVSISMPISD